MSLDPDIQRWVNALRSGNYQQVTQRLHTVDGFCCLGVCRDVLGTTWDEIDDDGFLAYMSHLGEENELDLSSLPESISGFLLSTSYDGEVEDIQQFLIEMNDDGHSFAEIADWIEAHADKAAR